MPPKDFNGNCYGSRVRWTPEELEIIRQWAKEDEEELARKETPKLELVVNHGITRQTD